MSASQMLLTPLGPSVEASTFEKVNSSPTSAIVALVAQSLAGAPAGGSQV